MRIREGKRYVTRDGRVTGATRRDGDVWTATFPQDEWFEPLWRYWRNGGKHVGFSSLDLVAEYREDGK